MAMSELKQRLLKIELAKIGFPDAVYNAECGFIQIDPVDYRMPKVYNNGDIGYGSEYDILVKEQINPIVKMVNEIVAAWERGSNNPVEDVSKFRILNEYNGVVLAARDDSELGFGHGFEFVTWRYTLDREGFEHGNYTTDYETAKEDFATRSGLIDKSKMFSETQLKVIHQGLVKLGCEGDLSVDDMQELDMAMRKVERIIPKIIHHEIMENHELALDDGLFLGERH